MCTFTHTICFSVFVLFIAHFALLFVTLSAGAGSSNNNNAHINSSSFKFKFLELSILCIESLLNYSSVNSTQYVFVSTTLYRLICWEPAKLTFYFAVQFEEPPVQKFIMWTSRSKKVFFFLFAFSTWKFMILFSLWFQLFMISNIIPIMIIANP